MDKARAARLAGALALLAAGSGPVPAQGVICCNQIVDVGGNWVGAGRICDLSSAPPAQRTRLCEQLAGCAAAAASCSGPRQNGSNCHGKMPPNGVIYAGTLDGRMHATASHDSPLVASPPSGTRLRYTRTTMVDGRSWYYIEAPGRPPGWMPSNHVSCTRPQEPPGPRIVRDTPSALQPSSRGGYGGARG